MKRIVYREEGQADIVIAEIMTNKSLTVWEALEICGVDMDKFSADHGWEAWNPEAIYMTD